MNNGEHHARHACHHAGDGPDNRGQYDDVPADFSGTVYTCPMHPEVRRTGPGACPLCGMALEAESGAGEEDPVS